MTRVLVVDDHELIRRGVGILLGREPSIEAVWEANSAAEALEIAAREPIDVATVDVLMPNTSGITLISQLHEIQPKCRVLVLSVIEDPDLIADILRAGACGFVTKMQPIPVIVGAIHAAARGERYLPPEISVNVIDEALTQGAELQSPRMTKREHEVFELLISGQTNYEIATRLAISLRTVEAHRHHITQKISTRSLIELQRLVARHLST